MFFRFTTAGESHGKALVAIVEGMPAGLTVDVDAINHELWRRQQGYGRSGRMKIERDEIEIVSGVKHGETLGSPIAITIENKDFMHWQEVMSVSSPTVNEDAGLQKPVQSKVENDSRKVTRPRPGHADLAGGQKFATRDLRNILERASARETASRVAAGALAKQLLAHFGIEVRSHVIQLGGVPSEPPTKDWKAICEIKSDSPLNCVDEIVQSEMIMAIDRAKENGDTLGGVYEVVAKGVPVGLGSHTSWYEKLDGRIAQALMSIHATKAVEIGTAFSNSGKLGSEVHDEIFWSKPSAAAGSAGAGFERRTNRAGGLEGGITNGEELRIRGYMKPISTLRRPLRSVDIDTKQEEIAAFERSDVTAVPAAGVIGESMLAIVLANSMREKFGGDSLPEMKRNFDSYIQTLATY
jgi:chorismate synthase